MNDTARDFTVGPLAFRLETTTGFLRSIRFLGHEVLRGIYPAVRDAEWKTIQPRVAPVRVQAVNADRIGIELSARVASDRIDLEWAAEIEARATGFLRYAWRGRALRDFNTNRTGLCVLHPAEAAGRPCTVEHADGASEAGWLPEQISPHQPFRNLRAITHAFADHAEARVHFEGEVFEMEDQRNWTDASFKTYCRPLDWPRPHVVRAGEIVVHTVTVEVRGAPLPAPAVTSGARLAPTPTQFPLPPIGIEVPGPIPPALRARALALQPKHLRIESTASALSEVTDWARHEAEAFGCAVHLAVVGATTAAPTPAALPPKCMVQLFNAAGNCAGPDVVAAWRNAGHLRLATGTRNHFTELNRERPSAATELHAVAFGLNAQVHAFDDASLLETISQHRVVAEHASAIGGGADVVVGPITLGPTADFAEPRLHTDFAALWLLASLAQLAAARRVVGATFFRTHGPGGVLSAREVTPAERLFQRFGAATKACRLAIEADAANELDAVLLQNGGRRTLLVANRGDAARELQLSPFVPGSGTVTLSSRSLWQQDLSS